jgi:quinol monooxygenase YgiN
VAGVLVVTRYVVPEDEAMGFAEQARAALDALRSRPGCRSAVLGRAADDPTLWTLTTRWDSVGSYRRALGSYEVKLNAVPLMYRAVDEATAFEELLAWDPDAGLVASLPSRASDAGSAAPGSTGDR